MIYVGTDQARCTLVESCVPWASDFLSKKGFAPSAVSQITACSQSQESKPALYASRKHLCTHRRGDISFWWQTLVLHWYCFKRAIAGWAWELLSEGGSWKYIMYVERICDSFSPIVNSISLVQMFSFCSFRMWQPHNCRPCTETYNPCLYVILTQM